MASFFPPGCCEPEEAAAAMLSAPSSSSLPPATAATAAATAASCISTAASLAMPGATHPTTSLTSACSAKRRCLNSLPPECLETSLVAFAERLYGEEPEEMTRGLLDLLRMRFIARDGNAARFHRVLAVHQGRLAHHAVGWADGLPSEVLALIVRRLSNDPAALARMAQACRSWNREIHRRQVWQRVCNVSLGCGSSPQAYASKLAEVLGQNDYRPSLLSVAPLVLAGADLAYRHGPATPFLLAAFHGHLHVVKFLLSNGANPMDRSSCGKNALQLAAMRNHQEVVAWLGRHGFSLKDRDECGNSTVHLAALGGARKVLAYLKAQGVPVAEINSDGMSPLHYAAMNGNKEVVSMLVAGGFDLPVDQRAYNGQTPVHRACLYGRCPAIGVLMQHGADLTARDARGANVVMLTALGCVCKYAPNNDVAHHAAMIERLLTAPNSNFMVNDVDNYGRSALHYARAARNFLAAETLIRLGADQELRDEFGATPADHDNIVRAIHNRQEPRLMELLARVSGLALTFATSARPQTHFNNSHLRLLCRCLRGNTTVRKVILIDTDVNVSRNMEALLELFSENRTLCELDFGEGAPYRLPLVVREYLALNESIRNNGGQCPALPEFAAAVGGNGNVLAEQAAERELQAALEAMDASADQ